MALDLANGYIRKDSASASNVYYGYSLGNPTDTDKVYAIRKVNNAGNVETVTWTNGDPISFNDSWSSRTYSFGVPGGNLNLTWSRVTTPERQASFTWSQITGVSKYLVTIKNSNGQILNPDGSLYTSQYFKSFGSNLFNTFAYTQGFVSSGTYSITLTATNVAGSITSIGTFSFS